jgi:hypothetical protein
MSVNLLGKMLLEIVARDNLVPALLDHVPAVETKADALSTSIDRTPAVANSPLSISMSLSASLQPQLVGSL